MLPTNDTLANYSAVGASCGFLYGAHSRTDGGDSLIPDINSSWSMPLYSCASATKAKIKQVTFRINGTTRLSDLIIDRIDDKVYKTKEDMPLWGVENMTNFTIRYVRPFWGIVSPEVGGREDISTIRREYLWLPGYSEVSFGEPIRPFGGESNIPGNIIFSDALDATYSISNAGNAQTIGYTAQYDYALYEKWRSLSGNGTGAGLILNLIWTDLMANSVVGTRSWLSDAKPYTFNWVRATTDVSVKTWSRKIKYHIAYAIPAAISLLFTIFIASLAFLLLLFRRTGTGRLRVYLAQTSAGRILGTFLYPGMSDPLGPRKIWIRQVGMQPVNLMGGKGSMLQTANLGSGPSYSNIPVTEEVVDMRYKSPAT
jgi:hypothetical protein